MKFAKELDDDLIPEWRAKYFDYRVGKKRIKAITKALHKLHLPPESPHFSPPERGWPKVEDKPLVPTRQDPPRAEHAAGHSRQDEVPEDLTPTVVASSSHSSPQMLRAVGARSPLLSHEHSSSARRRESAPCDGEATSGASGAGYGSMVDPVAKTRRARPPSLLLPGPALSPITLRNENGALATAGPTPGSKATASMAEGGIYSTGHSHPHASRQHRRGLRAGVHSLRRPSFVHRMLSVGASTARSTSDVPMEHLRLFDRRRDEFFDFLDGELDKIETFYCTKESEAARRLEILESQLFEMKDRRVQQVAAAELEFARVKKIRQGRPANGIKKFASAEDPTGNSVNWKNPWRAVDRLRDRRVGENTKSLTRLGPNLAKSPLSNPSDGDGRRDFGRRKASEEVPYWAAKRKLKLALREFYRGLELLKSYAMLNRKAFRKINKKYEKQVQSKSSYMIRKVDKAHFVRSDQLEKFIASVEDLYAQYLEGGNRKVAVTKLRKKLGHPEVTGGVFRNGLFLAAGSIFGIEGLIRARQLYVDRPWLQTQVSFLLQLYGGYFLSLVLFLLFCMACKIWNRTKINYVFVFEFDTRHNLDWRQLSEIPSLLSFVCGLVLFLNFQLPPPNPLFRYWPVLLAGITTVILFAPIRVLYYQSRQWWAYSNFRLIFAGLYPVEFRDFFLGDMYCSLTYAMGNIEVFFCLYAQRWSRVEQCSSSHSRLLGFLSCLPGIWRALQCLRRYYDTGNVFPHLVNCGKYGCTILFYMTLSLYRIENDPTLKALFLTFATVNSVYCSFWDLLMDWSLGDPTSANKYLRDVLGYKHKWVYYLAMLVDPLLRFNWILYVAVPHELQHSALLSFFISLSEILRRAMWVLFRVENEHCTNVGRFRASRDIPLPYEVPAALCAGAADDVPALNAIDDSSADAAATRLPSPSGVGAGAEALALPPASAADLESAAGPGGAAPSPRPGSLRRRQTLAETGSTPIIRGLARVGTAFQAAHTQDYERKRRGPPPSAGGRAASLEEVEGSSDDEDDDDDDDDEDPLAARSGAEVEVATAAAAAAAVESPRRQPP